MTNKLKSLAILLGALLVLVAGWYTWSINNSHGQGVVETHEHFHVHGQGVDHGHKHPGSSGDLSHSHPHQHDRHHHGETELPEDQQDLTEIGHSHAASSGTTHFWAKLVKDDDKFVLSFFASQESSFKATVPTAGSLNAQILNGNDLDGEAKFEKSGDNFVAKLPAEFLVLPTHVFRFDNLEFGDVKMDAFLSISR